MTTNQAIHLVKIMQQAESHRKGDYRVYESLKRRIADINLTPSEYELAIRRLAEKLRV